MGGRMTFMYMYMYVCASARREGRRGEEEKTGLSRFSEVRSLGLLLLLLSTLLVFCCSFSLLPPAAPTPPLPPLLLFRFSLLYPC